MDKKKFGLFIKESRLKKGYTQKELSELLYLDVTAISKWERGISYPDITMIPDICRVLDVNEHELIESSKDTEYHKMKKEANTYKKIKNSIFITSSILYGLAIFVCFIVNIAVNHTLSWFFIVLASCCCGFTFCPTILRFVKKWKFSIFVFSTFISLFFLYLTCSIYTKNYWFMVAATGTLLGYFAFFFPVLFYKQESYLKEKQWNQLKKYFLLIYTTGLLINTIIMLIFINLYSSFNLNAALKITLYSFIILFVISGIHLLNWNRQIKIGIDSCACGFYLVGLAIVLAPIAGEEDLDRYFKINFTDWNQYSTGNVSVILLVTCFLIGIIFLFLGFKKEIKEKRK